VHHDEAAHADSLLPVEVTRVSQHGIVLRIGSEELRLPFERFPWFRQARADRLSTVEWQTPDHLFWPRLGIELSLPFIRGLAIIPESES
jgi:hypothetical protein